MNLSVIAAFLAFVLHDSLWPSAAGGSAEASRSQSAAAGDWTVWAATLGPLLALALVAHFMIALANRALERTERARYALLAERMASVVRHTGMVVHVLGVLLFGWLDAVRGVVGDVILIDELLALLPVLMLFASTWWAMYPIDRKVRDAGRLLAAERGLPTCPVPTARQHLAAAVRHQLLIVLLPIIMISAWAELTERLVARAALALTGNTSSGFFGNLADLLRDHDGRSAVLLVLQLLGVVIVFIIAPAAMRLVWDTQQLAPGPLRDRLLEICTRHHVPVRELLVWRTYGSLINGAVMGLVGRFRYILLTDALLDTMPQRQIEAVMAHEVAHVRCRHMPWLAAVMLASVGVISIVGALATTAFGVWLVRMAGALSGSNSAVGELLLLLFARASELAVIAASLAGAAVCFGFVSRRFEWQADAWSVKCLSELTRVSPEISDHAPEADAVLPPVMSFIVGYGLELPPALIARTAPAQHGNDTSAKMSPQNSEADGRITHEAVAAMVGALETVAELNFVQRHRRSFRHGSLAYRQARLRLLNGLPLGPLPIDRTVEWIKLAAAVGLALCALTMFLSW